MASLRGATQLWTEDDVASGGGASAAAHVGSKPYVAVFIANVASGGALTFGIQVASIGRPSAGKNEAEDADLVWHSYYSWGDPSAPVVITVADNAEIAYDLSPFAPELIRLTSVEGFTVGEVVASVTASGPN